MIKCSLRRLFFGRVTTLSAIAASISPACAAPADAEATYISGTAFFYNRDGDMFTNRHVVEACVPSSIAVRLPDGQAVPASVIAISHDTDLAALRTNHKAESFAAVRLHGGRYVSLPEAVEDVFTAGFGAPQQYGFRLQMRWGQIQGFVDKDLKRAKTSAINVARIDADPGASGSPVLDYSGLLVGVVYARTTAEVADVGKLTDAGYGRHAVFLFNNDAVVGFANANGLNINAWGGLARKDPVAILSHLQDITGLVVCRESHPHRGPR